MRETISIIGIGLSLKNLPQRSIQIINEADVLVGGERQLSLFKRHTAEKIVIKRDLNALIKKLRLKAGRKRVVVLASGDPNFYGIATLFYDAFGRENISIVPNITAFQGAFARIKYPWHNASLVSLHGRGMQGLDDVMSGTGPLVIYCDGEYTPARTARYIIDFNKCYGEFNTWLFENLGQKHERIREGKLKKFMLVKASPLSMMIIMREKRIPSESCRQTLGIPDTDFIHKDNLITKKDIRLISLSRLGLGHGKVLWDIGAGSGSIAVESGNLFPTMKIFAVEKRRDRFYQIRKNVKKLRVQNVTPILGIAPQILKTLPDPDSVFIGGSGNELKKIMQAVKKRAQANARVVINCVTLETLSNAVSTFKDWKWDYMVTAVQLSTMTNDLPPPVFRAENPVFIVAGFQPTKN